LIPFMDLGARTSLIIYLHPWSESIALAPLISQISPDSSKIKVLRVHPKSEGKSLDLEKTYFRDLFLVLR
jgi:hypothetical protein